MAAVILHERGGSLEGQEIVDVFHHRPSGRGRGRTCTSPRQCQCALRSAGRACVVANSVYIEEWHKSLKFTCRGAGGAQSLLTNGAICSLSAVGAAGLIWSSPAVS